MDAIIKKIIDIEQKAQQIVNEAEDEKKLIEQNLSSEVEKMHEEIRTKANKKIEQVRKLELSEADLAVKDVVLKSEQQIKNMIQYSNEKRAQWEELIIQRVIGR